VQAKISNIKKDIVRIIFWWFEYIFPRGFVPALDLLVKINNNLLNITTPA
jgi:hypothetical protein